MFRLKALHVPDHQSSRQRLEEFLCYFVPLISYASGASDLNTRCLDYITARVISNSK